MGNIPINVNSNHVLLHLKHEIIIMFCINICKVLRSLAISLSVIVSKKLKASNSLFSVKPIMKSF